MLQLQSTENEKFVNKFHEKNQPVINVIKTLVHRIGENNKKIFKNSAKTLIFLGRQKILKGSKLVASEFVGYTQLVDLKNSMSLIHFSYQKSVIMATYMLCGFANFMSIGIQIGGIGALAPERRGDLASLGVKALFGGTMASLLSATIAGSLF